MKKSRNLMIVLLVMLVFVVLVGCNRGDGELGFDYLHADELLGEHFELRDVPQAETQPLDSGNIPETSDAAGVVPPGSLLPGMIDFTQTNNDFIQANVDSTQIGAGRTQINVDDSSSFRPTEHHFRISEEITLAQAARDDRSYMLTQFIPLFNRLLNGESVRFYDEFYSYFPEDTQYYFTVYEAIDHDERLSYISSFGSHNLRVIRGNPEYFRRAFLFVNPERPFADVFVRPTHAALIEAIQQTNHLIEIPDMPGYYFIHNIALDHILGFILADGENYFHVSIGHSHVLLGDFPCGFAQVMISTGSIHRSITEMIEFMRGLQFCEFIEGWGRYNEY